MECCVVERKGDEKTFGKDRADTVNIDDQGRSENVDIFGSGDSIHDKSKAIRALGGGSKREGQGMDFGSEAGQQSMSVMVSTTSRTNVGFSDSGEVKKIEEKTYKLRTKKELVKIFKELLVASAVKYRHLTPKHFSKSLRSVNPQYVGL